jgi:hypothetical protein
MSSLQGSFLDRPYQTEEDDEKQTYGSKNEDQSCYIFKEHEKSD